jgi:hypothetical protein
MEGFDRLFSPVPVASQLTDGHKRAIVQMYATGASVPDLAKWYRVDQATIREVLRPHIKFGVEPGRGR